MPGLLRQGGFVGVLVLLIACAAWTAPEAARPQASLVVIEVQEPLSILGKTYPGGRLTLRAVGEDSPGVTMHAVALNGDLLGVLPARHATASRERTQSTGLFGRDGKGRLHLLGYVSAERETYRF